MFEQINYFWQSRKLYAFVFFIFFYRGSRTSSDQEPNFCRCSSWLAFSHRRTKVFSLFIICNIIYHNTNLVYIFFRWNITLSHFLWTYRWTKIIYKIMSSRIPYHRPGAQYQSYHRSKAFKETWLHTNKLNVRAPHELRQTNNMDIISICKSLLNPSSESSDGWSLCIELIVQRLARIDFIPFLPIGKQASIIGP